MSTAFKYSFTVPPAIVVGTCGHGLATIRALRQGGVPVIALEANFDLSGAHTRLATVLRVTTIHGQGLVDVLSALREKLDCPGNPVLFLTNDGMVKTLATQWPQLAPHYLLSWAHCRDSTAKLLGKDYLETYTKAQGCHYPPSWLVASSKDIDAALAVTGANCIIKPAKPLSKFKTALPASPKDLANLISRFEPDLPFIAQRFIPGDDTCIYFCALYLDHGKELARFDGRKLRSWPMGHTTVAEPSIQQDVYQETLKFFNGLGLSGTVSLELKRDADGRLWVIEPTVGRTDFWLGLCTANGVNLPLTEYNSVLSLTLPQNKQHDLAIWFNEERDPFGRFWLARHPTLSMGQRTSTYLYLHGNDPIPALLSIKKTFFYLLAAVGRRLLKPFK